MNPTIYASNSRSCCLPDNLYRDQSLEGITHQLTALAVNRLFEENEKEYVKNKQEKEKLRQEIQTLNIKIRSKELKREYWAEWIKWRPLAKLINNYYQHKKINPKKERLEDLQNNFKRVKDAQKALKKDIFHYRSRPIFLGSEATSFQQTLHIAQSSPIAQACERFFLPIFQRHIKQLKTQFGSHFNLQATRETLADYNALIKPIVEKQLMQHAFLEASLIHDPRALELYQTLCQKACDLTLNISLQDQDLSISLNRCAVENELGLLQAYSHNESYLLFSHPFLDSHAIPAIKIVFGYLKTKKFPIQIDTNLPLVTWLADLWSISSLKVWTEKKLLHSVLEEFLSNKKEMLDQLLRTQVNSSTLTRIKELSLPSFYRLEEETLDRDFSYVIFQQIFERLRELTSTAEDKNELENILLRYLELAQSKSLKKSYQWYYLFLNQHFVNIKILAPLENESLFICGNKEALQKELDILQIHPTFFSENLIFELFEKETPPLLDPQSSTLSSSLKTVFKYLKNLKIDFDIETIVEVYYLSDFLLISRLKQECLCFIGQQLFKSSWTASFNILSIISRNHLFPDWLNHLIILLQEQKEKYDRQSINQFFVIRVETRLKMLHLFARHGQIRLLDEWIQHHSASDIDVQATLPALAKEAASYNQVETLRFLFKRVPAPPFFSPYSWGLEEAIEQGHIEAAEFLLQKGARIGRSRQVLFDTIIQDISPLSVALDAKQEKMAVFLADKEPTKYENFYIAAKRGYVEVVRCLLANDKKGKISKDRIAQAFFLAEHKKNEALMEVLAKYFQKPLSHA